MFLHAVLKNYCKWNSQRRCYNIASDLLDEMFQFSSCGYRAAVPLFANASVIHIFKLRTNRAVYYIHLTRMHDYKYFFFSFISFPFSITFCSIGRLPSGSYTKRLGITATTVAPFPYTDNPTTTRQFVICSKKKGKLLIYTGKNHFPYFPILHVYHTARLTVHISCVLIFMWTHHGSMEEEKKYKWYCP